MVVVEVQCCLLTHTTTGGGAVPALDCCVTFPEFITAASKKLGVHQIWIVFGLGFVTTAFLFFGFGAGLLWCVLGTVVDRGALLTQCPVRLFRGCYDGSATWSGSSTRPTCRSRQSSLRIRVTTQCGEW